jgi:hypothetical protein
LVLALVAGSGILTTIAVGSVSQPGLVEQTEKLTATLIANLNLGTESQDCLG